MCAPQVHCLPFSSHTRHEITKLPRFVKVAANWRLVSNFLSKSPQSSFQMYSSKVEHIFFAKWQSEIVSNITNQVEAVYRPTHRFQLFSLSLLNCWEKIVFFLCLINLFNLLCSGNYTLFNLPIWIGHDLCFYMTFSLPATHKITTFKKRTEKKKKCKNDELNLLNFHAFPKSLKHLFFNMLTWQMQLNVHLDKLNKKYLTNSSPRRVCCNSFSRTWFWIRKSWQSSFPLASSSFNEEYLLTVNFKVGEEFSVKFIVC